MKKSIKKTAFLAVISLFTLNFFALGLYAMEQKTSQPAIRQPLSLTQLAANAYIKNVQKDSKNSKESALAIKEELETKCPLITQEIEQILNQRLSQNNDMFIEQELSGKVIAILPESNQIVTEENLGDDNNSISFWKLYSHDSNNSNGLLSGVAASMPGATQALAAKSVIDDGKWVRAYTLELPEYFKTMFVNENMVVCGIATESENDDQLFEQRKVALFIRSKNAFELKEIIEMEHSIVDCAFSAQDNSLAFALDNNTVVFWRYNKQAEEWQAGEIIVNAAPTQHIITNIAFLHQSYEETPLFLIHYMPYIPFDEIIDENTNIKPSAVTIWQAKDAKWCLLKELLKANYIAMHKSANSKSITLHATHYNEQNQTSHKTIFLQENTDRTSSYTSKEFADHRQFSPDGTLSIYKKEDATIIPFKTSFKIVDVATEDILKTIGKNYFYSPIFINNDNLAIQWSNCTKIVSLNCSTNFALCNQLLQKAKEQENVNLDDLLQSSLVTQLQPDEKKSVIDKAQKLKSEQSLKGKIQQFRTKCRSWSYRNPDTYGIMMLGTWLGISLTTVCIHNKIDPKFSYFPNILNDPINKGILIGTVHSAFGFALTRRISKFFFGS